eukprot:SAG31_NODE_43212_length_268_cov_0.609467_1_plen_56_part_01
MKRLFPVRRATAEAAAATASASELLLNATATALISSGFDPSSAVDGVFSREVLDEL